MRLTEQLPSQLKVMTSLQITVFLLNLHCSVVKMATPLGNVAKTSEVRISVAKPSARMDNIAKPIGCPLNKELVDPCSCREEGAKMVVVCATLENFQDLRKSPRRMQKFHTLRLLHVPFNLEEYIFSGINVKEIIISNTSLRHVSGKAFHEVLGLEMLDLSFNQLSNFSTDVGCGNKLKLLDLSNNLINIIIRKKNHCSDFVEKVDLSSNRITDIEDIFYKLRNVSVLGLRNNSIESLIPIKRTVWYLADPILVKILDVSNNSIKGINRNSLLKYMPQLQLLNISYNMISNANRQVEDGAFSRNKELRVLDMSHNYLTLLSSSGLSGLQALENLNLSGNSIAKVAASAFTGLARLRELDLRDNRLASISVDTLSQTSDTRIHLEGNPWLCDCALIDVWVELNARNYSHGQNTSPVCSRPVGLQSKKLVELTKKELFQTSCRACPQPCDCRNRDKRIVDCRGKRLKNIPRFIPSWTKTLILDDNEIDSLADLSSPAFCGLDRIDVNNNRLSQLLGTMPESCLNLTYLSASNNSLSSLSLRDLAKKLQFLNVSHNKITTLQAKPEDGFMQFLATLDLSHNMIRHLPELSLIHYVYVKTLNLSHNNLENLDCIFAYTSDLQVLDISHNKLHRLKDCSSQGPWDSHLPPQVQKLYLSHNQFQRITDIFQFLVIPSPIQEITLGHNDWSCACDVVEELKEWILKHAYTHGHKVLQDYEEVRCVLGPGQLKGRDMGHLNYDVICNPDNSPNWYMIAGVITMILVFLFIIIFMSWFRYCMHLPCCLQQSTYEYDAFVCYSGRDSTFVTDVLIHGLATRGYKVLYHDRDFVPGRTIIENIRQAIKNSHCMIVVVTSNFMRSGWTSFEFRQGIEEPIHNRRRYRIIPILYGDEPDMNDRDIDPLLRQFLLSRTYIRWENSHLFWTRVTSQLPRPRPDDNSDFSELQPDPSGENHEDCFHLPEPKSRYSSTFSLVSATDEVRRQFRASFIEMSTRNRCNPVVMNMENNEDSDTTELFYVAKKIGEYYEVSLANDIKNGFDNLHKQVRFHSLSDSNINKIGISNGAFQDTERLHISLRDNGADKVSEIGNNNEEPVEPKPVEKDDNALDASEKAGLSLTSDLNENDGYIKNGRNCDGQKLTKNSIRYRIDGNVDVTAEDSWV